MAAKWAGIMREGTGCERAPLELVCVSPSSPFSAHLADHPGGGRVVGHGKRVFGVVGVWQEVAVVGGGRRRVGWCQRGAVVAGGGRWWSDYVPGQVSPSAHDNNNAASPTTTTLGPPPRLARFFWFCFI